MARSRNAMPAITRIVGIGVSFSAATTLSITHLPRFAYPAATNYSSSTSISLPGVISTNPKLGEFTAGNRSSGEPIASSHALIGTQLV
jgi:hypothetical protein